MFVPKNANYVTLFMGSEVGGFGRESHFPDDPPPKSTHFTSQILPMHQLLCSHHWKVAPLLGLHISAVRL